MRQMQVRMKQWLLLRLAPLQRFQLQQIHLPDLLVQVFPECRSGCRIAPGFLSRLISLRPEEDAVPVGLLDHVLDPEQAKSKAKTGGAKAKVTTATRRAVKRNMRGMRYPFMRVR